jgi:hypothetical protein
MNRNFRFKFSVILFCLLPINGVGAHGKIDYEGHVQYETLGNIIYKESIETSCQIVRTEPLSVDLFHPPIGMFDGMNIIKESKSGISREDYQSRRNEVMEKLKAFMGGYCQNINQEALPDVHQNVSLQIFRQKRALPLVLAIFTFSMSAAALSWTAYQQLENNRVSAQLKAEMKINTDVKDVANNQVEHIDVLNRQNELILLDRYLDDCYLQYKEAVNELTSAKHFGNIRSESLKQAIANYTGSVFAHRFGKYHRILTDSTSVAPVNCSVGSDYVNYRICLHYAPSGAELSFTKVMDYGRFYKDRSIFARIAINDNWLRMPDGQWASVTLFECDPYGRKLWLCPKAAIKLETSCTPDNLDGCPIDAVAVDKEFFDAKQWQGGYLIATNFMKYKLVENHNGTEKISERDVPPGGVFFLQIPEGWHAQIGENEPLNGNSPSLKIHAHQVPTTLVEVDEARLAKELAKLKKHAIRLAMRIDSDGRAFASAAGESDGLFSKFLSFFGQLRKGLAVAVVIMGIVAVIAITAYCGCTPATLCRVFCRCCHISKREGSHRYAEGRRSFLTVMDTEASCKRMGI